MKIALCGTAPSSYRKAPFGDPSFLIWGCSPGLYPIASRIDAWFEVHRWEPPVIGRADQQVPWFTPEYVAWMATRKCVIWMREKVTEIPTSQVLPWEALTKKYGHFFFTSSLSWMAAMAIESILLNRELLKANDGRAIEGEDMIGFWGVDMAANDELYSGQRAGCQFFATLAASLGIKIYVPPESDLMAPTALYGIEEGSHRSIRMTARKQELLARRQQAMQAVETATREMHYLNGALEDMDYHMRMWLHEGEILGTKFEDIFATPALLPEIVVPQASESVKVSPVTRKRKSNGAAATPPG